MWDVVEPALDLRGAYETMDHTEIQGRFMVGNLRDGVRLLTWALDKAKVDPIDAQIKAQSDLVAYAALTASDKVTRVHLDLHLNGLLKAWSTVAGNIISKPSPEFTTRLLALPSDSVTSKQ